MRNWNTIELHGFWEKLYNPDFKPVEFDGFRKQAGLNSFVLTPKRWIETTNAIGSISPLFAFLVDPGFFVFSSFIYMNRKEWISYMGSRKSLFGVII